MARVRTGLQYNSGKKSLGLDMRNEKGKEIIRELAKVSIS
jgi:crotonobetainyl-CoA:carnitine CoA-transferase CaiB-like acyl-CoA transferase